MEDADISIQFSMVTSNIIEAMVSAKRLSDFFNADELQPDTRQVVESADLEQGDVVVSITNGEFSWNKDAVSPTLEDINLTVRKGDLIGVLGRVGAGKVRTWIFCVYLVFDLASAC